MSDTTEKVIQTVAIFGHSLAKETDPDFIAAYDSAKLVAQSGRKIINGGGPGVMYAATKGAKDGGGEVSVVYYDPKRATEFEGRAGLQLADEEQKEANYIDRTQKLLELGDMYVIFNGGTGTVSEFAMAWAVAKLYFGHHKPLVLYGAFWQEIMNVFWKHMKVQEDAYRVFKYAITPQDVIKHIDDYEKLMYKHIKEGEPCVGGECSLFL
ncbi:hypothetical protein A3H80_02115 [Candidatus Roizmanbacteria bacterium RIFCSPLOWO2_02_FULL_37_19]|uniref:Lysine decarboxylase n=1 Tax=Candidatus Roizmanbacteria bacterium RIFCSPHIGHO2_02_FULL_37_24 TaxID=1802037 RepID=A0A1F7H032_9BACT|nr:MAG: hypothetical protein A2862_02700 [Candidatus Roizmanbacteria bacterium RIFCSPHIGHO2_01_FULL_38_41]OGK24528.1 MAG: hypothetical protein A3C24_03195 [Candidatus Roizmanbacteria bacterium RIFCSPHIGHO2_02_FULL_37_24]OGK31982.1 MAG: hypothetical protein A3E10_04535 [Candidatus Roizmanbacteria bacterium RIFCSPHIGHO2_12_FULL_37_23]OGK43783.1 MAG: hypothetical protein A2956_04660 [Candidatus Roizmanbacteria bacterium RIFCSPLOWO2_01_FULL_37_57]OGK54337.1 MAG: hypothetical protein A3H80_02115 [Ca